MRTDDDPFELSHRLPRRWAITTTVEALPQQDSTTKEAGRGVGRGVG